MTDTTFVKSEKTYVKTEKLTVHKAKEPPRRTTVENPLTTEQRKTINALINDWATTSNLAKKPLHNGAAYTRLYEDGLQGLVNGIEQIEQSEFDQCCFYIKQRIMMLENSDRSGVTRQKDDWRKKRVTAIQTKRRKAGVSDDKFRSYIQCRWNVESITYLDDDELEQCYRYAMQKGATWTPPQRDILGTQQHREKSLGVLLDELEERAKAVGHVFDRNNITFSKTEILNMLADQDKSVWTDGGAIIAETTFNKFLTQSKMCKFKAGRRIVT